MRKTNLLKQLTNLISIFIVLLFLIPAQVGVAQIKRGKRFSKVSACLDCHDESNFTGDKKHQPFKNKECVSCHKPHGIVGVLRLKAEGNDLCFQCHDEDKLKLNRKYVHSPVNNDKCITCHDPHSGEKNGIFKYSST